LYRTKESGVRERGEREKKTQYNKINNFVFLFTGKGRKNIEN
jgi:hypothetical protein